MIFFKQKKPQVRSVTFRFWETTSWYDVLKKKKGRKVGNLLLWEHIHDRRVVLFSLIYSRDAQSSCSKTGEKWNDESLVFFCLPERSCADQGVHMLSLFASRSFYNYVSYLCPTWFCRELGCIFVFRFRWFGCAASGQNSIPILIKLQDQECL